MLFGPAEYSAGQQIQDRAAGPEIGSLGIVKALFRHVESEAMVNPDARIRVIKRSYCTTQRAIKRRDTALKRNNPVTRPLNPLMQSSDHESISLACIA